MKTKEEILNKYNQSNTTVLHIDYTGILSAMEEYGDDRSTSAHLANIKALGNAYTKLLCFEKEIKEYREMLQSLIRQLNNQRLHSDLFILIQPAIELLNKYSAQPDKS